MASLPIPASLLDRARVKAVTHPRLNLPDGTLMVTYDAATTRLVATITTPDTTAYPFLPSGPAVGISLAALTHPGSPTQLAERADRAGHKLGQLVVDTIARTATTHAARTITRSLHQLAATFTDPASPPPLTVPGYTQPSLVDGIAAAWFANIPIQPPWMPLPASASPVLVWDPVAVTLTLTQPIPPAHELCPWVHPPARRTTPKTVTVPLDGWGPVLREVDAATGQLDRLLLALPDDPGSPEGRLILAGANTCVDRQIVWTATTRELIMTTRSGHYFSRVYPPAPSG